MQDRGDDQQSRQVLHRRAQQAESEIARLTRGLAHLGHVLRGEPLLAERLLCIDDYWAAQAMDLDVLRQARRREARSGQATGTRLREE